MLGIDDKIVLREQNVALGLAGAATALTIAAFAVWLSNQKKKNGSSSSSQPVAGNLVQKLNQF